MIDRRYPIGRLDPDDGTLLSTVVDQIAALPADLRAAVAGLTQEQLDTPYREGGWTVRQVVHHLADSHLQGIGRFRMALTEERPIVTLYSEKRWAELPDAQAGPVETSLSLLAGLHARWAFLLRAMTPAQFKRAFVHPERGEMSLEQLARMYAWHGRHHLAHVNLVARPPVEE